jgi:putative endonuclease
MARDRHERARRGRGAEDAVAAWVVGQGMTLLARNLRVGKLEIDLVARDGAVVAIVEVRTRGEGSWQGAFGSIDGRKQQRLRRAAEILWLRRFSKLPGVERVRFDVAAVDLDGGAEPAIEYVKAAF